MVSISVESPEQTERRLRSVIAAADFVVLPGEWVFRDSPLTQPPRLDESILAVVRDEDSWCWLAPASGDEPELFAVLSFHFPAGLDNSGFVGWLATLLKQELGTGVFVVCGQNSDRGGIYDYWGCPAAMGSRAVEVVERLRRGSSDVVDQ